MSYDASNIINIVTRISAVGLSTANFGSAVIFADFSETGSIAADTMNTYTSLKDLAVNYPDTTEVYKCAAVWFGTTPNPGQIQVYQMEDQDPGDTGSDTVSLVSILNKARQSYWWYFTFFNKNVYQSAVAGDSGAFLALAQWGDQNDSMVPDCVSGASLTDVLDQSATTDVCSTLKNAGVRHCFSLASKAADGGDYAAVSLCAQFGSVLYAGQNTTISGEFKKLSVPSSEYTSTETTTMKTKQCAFYTVVDLQGSEDNGRVINSISHSNFSEWIDEVINLDAFVNSLRVSLYNALTSVPTKLPQTPAGQQILIAAANEVGQQYIDNNYLGPRTIIDPDDGKEKTTVGYEILTQPEDILTLSAADREARKSAPIKMRIYQAGAIQHVDVTVDVY